MPVETLMDPSTPVEEAGDVDVDLPVGAGGALVSVGGGLAVVVVSGGAACEVVGGGGGEFVGSDFVIGPGGVGCVVTVWCTGELGVAVSVAVTSFCAETEPVMCLTTPPRPVPVTVVHV